MSRHAACLRHEDANPQRCTCLENRRRLQIEGKRRISSSSSSALSPPCPLSSEGPRFLSLHVYGEKFSLFFFSSRSSLRTCVCTYGKCMALDQRRKFQHAFRPSLERQGMGTARANGSSDGDWLSGRENQQTSVGRERDRAGFVPICGSTRVCSLFR